MTQLMADFARWLAGGHGWLPILANAVLKATMLLAGAGLLTLALRRRSAAVRHLVWSMALAGSLATPVLMIVLPAWTLPVLPSAGSLSAERADPTTFGGNESWPYSRVEALGTSGPATPSAGDHPAPPAAGQQANPAPGTMPDPGPREAAQPVAGAGAGSTAGQLLVLILPGAATLLAIWGAVAFVLVGRLVVGHIRVRRMARRTAEAPGWEPLARVLSGQAGLARTPRFIEGAPSAMPMTWGLFRPVVMVPSVAADWPDARLRAVLLHELAHVRRRDCLTQTVAGLVCALYWFNPLAWVAAARLRAERERACDDTVLAAGADGGDYAEQLLDIARALRPADLLSWATVSMARRSQLEGRLLAILDPDLPRRTPTRAAAALAVLALAVLVPMLAAVEAGERATSGATSDLIIGMSAEPADVALLSPADAVREAADSAVRSASGMRSIGSLDLAVRDTLDSLGAAGTGQHPTPTPMPTPTPTPAPRVLGRDDQRQPVDQKIIDALVAALDDVDGDVRHQALVTLARIGDRRTTAALMKALDDTSSDVREQAAMALGRLRDPGAVDALIKALADPSPGVREHAAFALGQMRDVRAVEPLLAVVSDQNAEVREQAVFALSQLRDRRATPVLIKALGDADEDVREQSAFALSQLRDDEATPALMALLNDAKPDVREKAVFALSQLRDRRAVPALTKAVADADEDVREQAAFALSQLRDPAAVPALTTLLKDPKPDVREQAAFALGQIRDASAVEPLIAALGDESPDIQQSAALALGQLRDGRAVDALIAALRAASADVRQSAAHALGQIRDPKASDALTAALKDADADVRRAAALALSRVIGGRDR
ncbi:MAG: M56 family metallopeptidase [Acidobacteriota bacterium]